MERMTKQEAIRKHRKMWSWLSENPGKWKEEYLRKFDPEARLSNDCYLCDYVYKNRKGHCRYCLVEWPGGICLRKEGLYSKWLDAMDCEDYALAVEIAEQISKLPEKEA